MSCCSPRGPTSPSTRWPRCWTSRREPSGPGSAALAPRSAPHWRRRITMDELALLAEMRREVPGDNRYPDAQRALMAEIAGGATRQRRSRRPLVIAAGGLLAGAVAAGALVAL